MIKNYFKIAFRNIFRFKGNSIINIAGLAIGLTSVILIALFIQDELSYDQSFKDAHRIYRINTEGKMGESDFYAGYTPPPAGKALMDNFPEVESYTRIYSPKSDVMESQIDNEQRVFNEDNILAVDSNFLQVLSYPLVKGNAKTCLLLPNSIVISSKTAKKYFGDQDPMGKTLSYGKDKKPFKITGVLKDLSKLSASVKFDILMPIGNFGDVKYFNWSWVWLNLATYVKLSEKAAIDPNIIQRLESKFPAMIRVQAASAFERIGQPYDEFLKKGGKWDLHLQPLTDIHLISRGITSSISEQNDINNLYIFSIIAFFIIMLACVNFTNLATAQSIKRSKEIGIKKVLGSLRSQLIKQFLFEAAIYTIIAAVIALILVLCLLPYFNQFSGKTIAFQSIFQNWIWLLIIGLIALTAFFSGIYPAFYLTSFNPVHVLKGGKNSSAKSGFIRNSLVVFQFSIAIVLVICTIVVYTQLKYTQSKDLGFDKENLLVISNTEKLGNSEETFKQQLANLPEVKHASISTSVFSKGSFGDFYVPVANSSDEHIAKDLALGSYLVDDEFIPMLDLKIIKGRAFDAGFNDSLSVIINEAAAKQIGWTNPIGRMIRYPGGNNESYKVIGVLKDFNFESLHNDIVPFALFSKTSRSYDTGISLITVKLKAVNPQPIIQAIKAKWEAYQAAVPFEYSFMAEDLNAAYQADQRMAGLFNVFTFLSIFVACLGLFGLVAFSAQQRNKEIGVRKVLGASTSGIVKMLSFDFIKLVLIAIVIASPIAWYAMHTWLQDFSYRISIEWWVFVLAGMLAVVIAFATVSFQAIKAALANPIKSLRTE
jgi:putative ABC transport system permease protein